MIYHGPVPDYHGSRQNEPFLRVLKREVVAPQGQAALLPLSVALFSIFNSCRKLALIYGGESTRFTPVICAVAVILLIPIIPSLVHRSGRDKRWYRVLGNFRVSASATTFLSIVMRGVTFVCQEIKYEGKMTPLAIFVVTVTSILTALVLLLLLPSPFRKKVVRHKIWSHPFWKYPAVAGFLLLVLKMMVLAVEASMLSP